jgi:hypothetical protein
VASLALLNADVLEATSSVPWATTQALSAQTAFSGLQVRLLADGEPGACGAPAWADTGLDGGSWALTSAPCDEPAAGRNATLAQHVWTCTGCVFTGASTLTFSLPYSCQALALSAALGVFIVLRTLRARRAAEVFDSEAERVLERSLASKRLPAGGRLCPRCGRRYPDDAEFCGDDGAPLQRVN